MAEDMQFLPRKDILSLEQLQEVAESFVELGVRKIRLTGGEPLVRNNVLALVQALGALPGLEELHLTSNGSQLEKFARPLKQAGLTGINISLDSLNADRFKSLTRTGDLDRVLRGIDAAIDAGFERIKINAVILKGRNDDEILDLVEFSQQRGVDISFIEEMPLGQIDEHNRALSFCSSEDIRRIIENRHSLIPTTDNTGGPSRYWRIAGQDSRIGFISPHSHNFCHLCNRVRVTVEGKLLLCLGNEHSMDLKRLLDEPEYERSQLKHAIVKAMDIKPEKHEFNLNDEPQIVRFMNMTGG